MDLNQGICTSGLHLVILAWMDNKLSLGQAQNGLNFDFEVKFGLEGKFNYSPKQYIFYTYGPNLWSYFERVWSYRADKQVIDTHTHGHTDRRKQRQYPMSILWAMTLNGPGKLA